MSSTERAEQGQGPFYRSSQALLRLPLEFRWEVTRRHPYYLHFWQAARTPPPPADPQARLLNQGAKMLLRAIGFTGQPIDPALDFKHLEDDQLLNAWRDGAIAPLSIRGFVGVLSRLPAPARLVIGNFLVETADGSDNVEDRFERSRRLTELPFPELDQHPQLPMISVNLHAADRMILDGMRSQLRQWRQQFNVRSPRRHDARLTSYLRAWDMREGWTGSAYDTQREMRFQEIGRRLKTPLRTIANRYSSAFQHIVGYPYSPELWARIFGPIKLSRHFLGSGEIPRVASRRPLTTKTRRPIPETVLQPSGHSDNATGLVEAANLICDDRQGIDLAIDIHGLIVRGLDDQQIMEKLRLQTDLGARLVAYLRGRLTESRTGKGRRRASRT
jgi:hypothetical protein